MAREGDPDGDGRDGGKKPGGFIGSLRQALAAASREEQTRVTTSRTEPPPSPTLVPNTPIVPPAPLAAEAPATGTEPAAANPDDPTARPALAQISPPPLPLMSAAEAARAARGGTPNIPPVDLDAVDQRDSDAPPPTRVVRQPAQVSEEVDDMDRTERVRGKQQVERGEFRQDPVVGWLVVVGGPGIGAYRPVFEGNNTIGRGAGNRIAIDFGDDAISGEEQAYLRYDSADRSFLFVPNLAKTNVVSVNDQRPAQAVPLQAMDVITMGRTQLVFVPFCGPDFDWSEITGLGK